MFGSGDIQRRHLGGSTAREGGSLLFSVPIGVMFTFTWEVSVVVSWDPRNNPTARGAKQELRPILYREDHRNLERLRDLPRITKVRRDGFSVITCLVP